MAARTGGVGSVACTWCGTRLAPATALVEALRGIGYDYCGPGCRDRHADAVLAGGAGCELCDLDAAGDTGRCPAHLDDAQPGEAAYPLAS